MKKMNILKKTAISMLSAVILATSGPGFIGNVTTVKANIPEVDVDLTTLIPATNGDHENDMLGYDSGKYDSEITYSLQAMVDSGTKAAEDKADAAADADMDMDEAAAFGKIRWDIGYSILKDIYTYPKKWGNVKMKTTNRLKLVAMMRVLPRALCLWSKP